MQGSGRAWQVNAVGEVAKQVPPLPHGFGEHGSGTVKVEAEISGVDFKNITSTLFLYLNSEFVRGIYTVLLKETGVCCFTIRKEMNNRGAMALQCSR